MNTTYTPDKPTISKYARGYAHSDDIHDCVGASVRAAKISLNVCKWSSPQARAEGLIKINIAQLGSNTIDQRTFKQTLKLHALKRILPYLIQKHYADCKDKKLLEWKVKFENLAQLDEKLWSSFYSYYYYYYYHNHYTYHYYNYYHYNFHGCNYYYYYYYDYGDEILLLIADIILQTLIDLKSPGCEWLYLLEKQ